MVSVGTLLLVLTLPSILLPTVSGTPLPQGTLTPAAVGYLPYVASQGPRVTLELYGTIHAMGVIVSVDPTDDPDQDAIAAVKYRTGIEAFRDGFPLSRVSRDRFVGSLFWLEPGAVYDVRITLRDQDDLLHDVVLTGSATTREEVAVPTPVNSYYVSPDGSGSICSSVAPCSLREGISRAMPHDAVVLREGVYFEGEIEIPRSGRSGAPIMIRGYPNETAILDGADSARLDWTSMGGGIYRADLNTSDTNLVLADGQRLYHYSTFEDLQRLRWELPGFYTENGTIYVLLEDGSDPAMGQMTIGKHGYAFEVEQQHIYFINLTFRHYGQGMYRTALYLNNASELLIQGNRFLDNDLGILLRRASDRNVIQDNEFADTTSQWDWDAIKSLPSEYGLETGGIRLWPPDAGEPDITSRGTIVRRNTFHDFFDGFAACHWSTRAPVTNETDVYENTIYDVGDDGMEIDGPCSNCRVWNNTIHDALAGISVAPARIGPVYAIRNVIYRLGRTSGCPFDQEPPCGGTSFKFQNENPGSGPIYLFHNTVDAAVVGRGIFIVEPVTWPLLLARNNIWIGSARFAIEYDADDPTDFDYDNLIANGLVTLVEWKGTRYAQLQDFTRATGQEPHGLSVTPRFVDPSLGNYLLLPASQLIDAAVTIPGINDDFRGIAPDIGAHEYAPN